MKVVDNVNKKVEAVLPYTIIEDNLTMEYDYSKHEKINDFLFIRQISKKYDLYAFRFQKTEQQVIEEYLNNISKDADEEFLTAAKESIIEGNNNIAKVISSNIQQVTTQQALNNALIEKISVNSTRLVDNVNYVVNYKKPTYVS